MIWHDGCCEMVRLRLRSNNKQSKRIAQQKLPKAGRNGAIEREDGTGRPEENGPR